MRFLMVEIDVSGTPKNEAPPPTNQSASKIIRFPTQKPHQSKLPRPLTPIDSTTSPLTMASLAHTSRTLLRSVPRASTLPVRALSTTSSKCRASYPEVATTSSFDSPFKGMGNDAPSKIPDFSHYRSKKGTNSNLVFQYCEWAILDEVVDDGDVKKVLTGHSYGRDYGCFDCCWC